MNNHLFDILQPERKAQKQHASSEATAKSSAAKNKTHQN